MAREPLPFHSSAAFLLAGADTPGPGRSRTQLKRALGVKFMTPPPRRHWLAAHHGPASVAPSGPREACALTYFFLIVAVIYLPHSAGSVRRALPLRHKQTAVARGRTR